MEHADDLQHRRRYAVENKVLLKPLDRLAPQALDLGVSEGLRVSQPGHGRQPRRPRAQVKFFYPDFSWTCMASWTGSRRISAPSACRSFWRTAAISGLRSSAISTLSPPRLACYTQAAWKVSFWGGRRAAPVHPRAAQSTHIIPIFSYPICDNLLGSYRRTAEVVSMISGSTG
jgi:hypothetical protein